MLTPHQPFSPARAPLPYAWVIVLLGAVGILLSAPGQTIGVSVFTDDLMAALGLSRLHLSVAYLLGTATSAMLLQRVGVSLDRYGTRLVAALACLSLGLALLCGSRLGALSQLLAGWSHTALATAVLFAVTTTVFFLLRFTGQGTLTLASRTMVMRWFIRYRGRVMGVVGLCLGLVFSASPLLFELLIRRFGWAGAWAVMGAALACVFAPLLLLMFRDNPEECGLEPDALGFALKEQRHIEAEQDWTLRQARSTFAFWLFNATLSLLSLIVTGWTFHVVSIFAEAGLERGQAVSVFLPASAMGLVSTVVCGWLMDRPRLQYRLHWFAMLQLAALIGLCAGLMLLDRPAGFWLIIGSQGLASSLFGLLSSVTWPRYFGRKHLGAISGLNMAWMVFASALGPVVFAASKQWLGSYQAACGVCASAALVLLVAAPKAVRPELVAAGPPSR